MTTSNIENGLTLPILMAYTFALLPLLLIESKKNSNIHAIDSNTAKDGDEEEKDSINSLLWVVADQAKMAELDKTITSVYDHPPTPIDISRLALLTTTALLPRYHLVCFWLPELSEESILQHIPLLMRYRDLYAGHLLVAIENKIDLRAYGFTPSDIIDDAQNDAYAYTNLLQPKTSTLVLWQFNLYDYKKLPNWLNSKYWANPENWDKQRW